MENYKKVLLPQHLEDLRKSGLTDETIAEAGIYSANAGEVQRLLNVGGPYRWTGGLVFPYPGFDKPALHDGYLYDKPFVRVKPDYLEDSTGKNAKYLSPKGSVNHLYIPPASKAALENSDVPIYITEGEKKSLALAQSRFCSVGLSGVWSWATKGNGYRPAGKGTLLPDFNIYNFKNRKIFVVFDSDTNENPSIQQALDRLVKELRSRGAIVVPVVLPAFNMPGKIGADDFLELWGKQVFLNVCEDAEKSSAESEDEEDQKSPIPFRLVKLAEEKAEFFHDEITQAYARIQLQDHSEILSLNSHGFELWLSRLGYTQFKKAVSHDQIGTALQTLEAEAMYDGPLFKLQNRVSRQGEEIYYDLTDEKWKAVKISTSGWEVLKSPPILFKRYTHQLAQVIPAPDGDIALLRHYVNIKDEDEWMLLVVFLVSAFVPDIPHPVLNLFGLQGSSKSFLLKLLRMLIDPSAIETLSLPKKMEEALQIFDHNWFIPFDNLSHISPQFSDLLCRAVTGQGSSKRELYTNDDDVIYRFKRVIALNGINNVASKPDLLDRSITIELERISKDERKTESDLLKDFDSVRARILGGIFDTLSKAMVIQPNVKLSSNFRMADFVVWGCAIAQALGYTQEDFLKSYQKNQVKQNEDVIESNPVALVIVAFMEGKAEWTGPATSLFSGLLGLARAIQIDTRARAWPKDPSRLVKAINNFKPNLLEYGIEVKTGKRTATARILTIRWVKGKDPGSPLRYDGTEESKARILADVMASAPPFNVSNDANDSNDAKKYIPGEVSEEDEFGEESGEL